MNPEDQAVIELGCERLKPLTRVERVRMLAELNLALMRHGREPAADTCLHVIGNVPEEEWLAAVARMRTNA